MNGAQNKLKTLVKVKICIVAVASCFKKVNKFMTFYTILFGESSDIDYETLCIDGPQCSFLDGQN